MGQQGTIRTIGAGAALAFALSACAVGEGDFTTEAPTTGRSGNFIKANPEDKVEGEYLVVLNEEGMRADSIQAAGQNLLSNFGPDARMLRTYENALSGFLVEMPEEAAMILAQQPGVKFVEENAYVSIDATQDDATWGLDRTDQHELPLDSVYEYNNDGSGVHAYIIDTGIRTSHSDFGGRAHHGFSSIDDDNGSEDCNGHGTHVAGTVGGSEWGIAKNVQLYAVRVLSCSGGGTIDGVVAGIDWVTENAQFPAVANMSLGGGASAALDEAVQKSIEAGITYAVAAGNSNADACNFSPARVPEALGVGSTTKSDTRSSFSNWGSCVDIFAPGSDIKSAWHNNDNATRTISGTSMASPHVAGVAALYLAANPDASPSQVFDALTENATADVLSNVGNGSPNLLLYSGFVGEDDGDDGAAWGAFDDPNLPTKDNGTVCTSVEVTESGNAADVKIDLEGRHDWRSALRATLEHNGTTQEVFGTRTFPVGAGSFSLTGEAVDGFSGDAAGTWTLCIEDTDPYGDTGELESWGVYGGSDDGDDGDEGWGASDEPNLPTEDNGTVCTSVEVSGSGSAADVRVSLEGEHDWRSSLRGTLEHGGTTQEVFGTGTFSNGAGSFSLTNEPVDGFSGDAAGTWTLCIEDTDGFNDTGVLSSWGVEG